MPVGARSVSFWPGKTVGGIYVARYGAGSTLEYSELIVFSALARMAGRVGGWISHIYVDSEASVAGGQKIWGLPKERARFDWWNGELTVSYSGTPILLLPVWGAGADFHFVVERRLLVSEKEHHSISMPGSRRAPSFAAPGSALLPNRRSPIWSLDVVGRSDWTP
jgi:hypothetical protein